MKKEFNSIPSSFSEQWPGEFTGFSWQDFLTAIPSPLLVATSWKDNGRENACLQSWATFVGDGGEFVCILGSVSKRGHLYQSLMSKKQCVLNFPSADVYPKCLETIKHNGLEDDEITAAGLTAEKAVAVDAPRIKECFLNIECELLWMKEHFEGSRDAVAALKCRHISMDTGYCDEAGKGRYGRTGYLYNIHNPRNADTGETYGDCLGAIEKFKR